MKRLFLLAVALLLISMSFASSGPDSKPALNASQVMIPIGNTGKTISLLDLSRMSVKDVQAYTGQKMRFADRIAFKLAQMHLKKNINPDGTINSNMIANHFLKGGGITGFDLGGFALGLFLSVIGVLIAYLISDKGSSRIKWAWIGAAIGLLIGVSIAIF